jgi:hypothetical protein
MADLTMQTVKKNLLGGGNSFRQHGQKPGMEVIVYPSGQLLKGTDPANPPKSTIGPRLEVALRNSYYRNQVPGIIIIHSNLFLFFEENITLFMNLAARLVVQKLSNGSDN